jgi:hypothetical protein
MSSYLAENKRVTAYKNQKTQLLTFRFLERLFSFYDIGNKNFPVVAFSCIDGPLTDIFERQKSSQEHQKT